MAGKIFLESVASGNLIGYPHHVGHMSRIPLYRFVFLNRYEREMALQRRAYSSFYDMQSFAS